MGVTVGDKGVKLAATERRLVNGQIRADVLRIEDVFFGVTTLFPAPVIAEYLLVLLRQISPVYTVMGAYGADALGRRLNPSLLKKPRTRVSGGCLLPPGRSRR